MAWQDKGRKAAMGQFVRVKAERMIIVRFDGEPVEKEGKDFDGNKRMELQFPVTFWDERSVALRYKEGEAVQMVRASSGEAKMFPAGSAALMRELLAEDEAESIMGRTFIISHTGTARDTAYKFREIKVPRQKQAPVVEDEEEEEEEEAEAIPGAKEQKEAEEKHYEEAAKKRTKPRKPKAKPVEEESIRPEGKQDYSEEVQEKKKPKPGSKEDFHAKVAANAAREKAKEDLAPSTEELADEEQEGE